MLNATFHAQPYMLDWYKHNYLVMDTKGCIATEIIIKALNTIYVPQPKLFTGCI